MGGRRDSVVDGTMGGRRDSTTDGAMNKRWHGVKEHERHIDPEVLRTIDVVEGGRRWC